MGTSTSKFTVPGGRYINFAISSACPNFPSTLLYSISIGSFSTINLWVVRNLVTLHLFLDGDAAEVDDFNHVILLGHLLLYTFDLNL
jgi:hypothetical protein